MKDPWYKSNTKRGAVIGGIGAILSTIALMDQGKLDLATGITAIVTELGAIWTIFGFRNALTQ